MPVTLSPFGEVLRNELIRLPEEDEALAKLCNTMASPFTQGAIARGLDDEDAIPYQRVMSVSNAPVWALPWLAQFVGVTIPEGTSEATARAMILARSHQKRGKPDTIKEVTKTFLTGTKDVFLEEAADGNPFFFRVFVQTAEVPDPVNDPAKIKRAVTAVKPGGYTFELILTAGLTWAAAVNTWNAAQGTWDNLGTPPKP